MVFRLGFLVLHVYQPLRVQQLLVDVLQVLLENLVPFKVLFVFLVDGLYRLFFFLDEDVEAFVLLGDELGDLIRVVRLVVLFRAFIFDRVPRFVVHI